MRHTKFGKIIMVLLMLFTLGLIFPSCATTSVSQADTSRQSLMLRKDSQLHTAAKARKVKRAKGSRSYRKSKKMNNMYKDKKHKYSKRTPGRKKRRR